MPKKSPRTFKRLSYIALAFIKKNSTAAPAEAYVINISYGGVAIYTQAELEGQVEITLFHEEEGEKRALAETLGGTIAWRRPVGRIIACGIEFGNLNPDDHPVTMAVLEKFLK